MCLTLSHVDHMHNDLVHAHPYTADPDTGHQGLWRFRRGEQQESFSVAVTAAEIHAIAKRFDDATVHGAPLLERLGPPA